MSGHATALFLGLISGTSADGVDAALTEIGAGTRIVAARTTPYPDALRQAILALSQSRAEISLDRLGELDVAIGSAFADAALALLRTAGVAPDAVRAIGSHGQTVRHRPEASHPYTLQLGDPNVIAERTGITTVADFRRRDVAAGGQGAPLVPAFHAEVFACGSDPTAVLNLGGIANLTLLPAAGAPVRGFDTGPANCLLDLAAARWFGAPHDAGGALAAGGRVLEHRVAAALADPWFTRPPPKSTGREHFDWRWIEAHFDLAGDAAVDVLASLAEVTARSIADALQRHQPETARVYVCGGGVHNTSLLARLKALLAPAVVHSTAARGIDPDFVEAAAFAWLAHRRLADLPGSLPTVTGARGPRVLGAIFPP